MNADDANHDHPMADGENMNPSRGNLNDKGDDYVYFNRSTTGFSEDVVPRAKAFQLKLEHYYKLAVEAAVQRNTRYVAYLDITHLSYPLVSYCQRQNSGSPPPDDPPWCYARLLAALHNARATRF